MLLICKFYNMSGIVLHIFMINLCFWHSCLPYPAMALLFTVWLVQMGVDVSELFLQNFLSLAVGLSLSLAPQRQGLRKIQRIIGHSSSYKSRYVNSQCFQSSFSFMHQSLCSLPILFGFIAIISTSLRGVLRSSIVFSS